MENFFQAAHHLRKLCIDCAVSLPSAAVEDLFTVCMPNVSHLDISSFNDISIDLLLRLAGCFPNVETLHIEGLRQCSDKADACEHGDSNKWPEFMKVLFDDEHTFPKLRNFFMDDISKCGPGAPAKLLSWNRPLEILRLKHEVTSINFYGLITSPFKSTLTELYLGWYINNQDFRYIGELHNLKIFSLLLCLHTRDEEFIHLKKLSNLEELYISCGGEDCDLTPDGIIALFDLPYEMPERSFPYKLRSLALTDLHMCHKEVLEVIVRK
ncbi:unnamed protein product [Gongylonema pulchrum]|uniref:Uncharacterized protein n=1 Tax=Gongylonema pulchrum TaxID=637853 RepID=A0A3P7REI0_9BILA|nr:unnamed protein product [Gongylonema pulchrum]